MRRLRTQRISAAVTAEIANTDVVDLKYQHVRLVGHHQPLRKRLQDGGCISRDSRVSLILARSLSFSGFPARSTDRRQAGTATKASGTPKCDTRVRTAQNAVR